MMRAGMVFGIFLAVSAQHTPVHAAEGEIALGGFARPGSWLAAKTVPSATHIKSRDGDNLVVEYPCHSGSTWTYWKAGIETAPCSWHFLEGAPRVLEPRYLKPGTTLIVDLNSDLRFEEINRDLVAGVEAPFQVAPIDSVDKIPDNYRGWNAVDLVVLSTARSELLAKFSPQQADGLVRWVREGGRLFIVGGPSAPDAFTSIPWLKTFVTKSTDWGGPVTAESAAIETFASGQVQLGPVPACSLPTGGRTLLAGRSVDRESLRLTVDYLVGFGRVTAIGIDVNAPPVRQWPERNRLLRRLLPEYLDNSIQLREPKRNNNLGFDDLAGQVRAALDRPSRPRPAFSWLVGLTLLYLACIGPLDYLFVNRWLKRSVIGWLSFPALVAFAAWGYVAWGKQQQPPQPQIRQVDIVDLVPTESLARYFSWGQIEAADSGTYDLQIACTGTLLSEPALPAETCWQSVSGPEFGGLRISGIGSSMPPYQVATNNDPTKPGGVSKLPLPSGGSKGVIAQWMIEGLAIKSSSIRSAADSEEIRGQLVNPLKTDLRDSILIYRNNAYLLPTRFPAGGTINDLERVTRKNFNWRLTRRQLLEGTSTSVPWDAAMFEDLPRIMEILLFHGVAGGTSYTGLNNRPLRHLDLSHILPHDRAILMGTTALPSTTLIDDRSQSLGETIEHLSYVRIVIPVLAQLQP